jgi:hypothetical protein
MGSFMDSVMLGLLMMALVTDLFRCKRRPSLLSQLQGNRAWQNQISLGHSFGTLGPPRIEVRNGHMVLVGLGSQRPVDSHAEAKRSIAAVRSQISELLEISPSGEHGRPPSKKPLYRSPRVL